MTNNLETKAVHDAAVEATTKVALAASEASAKVATAAAEASARIAVRETFLRLGVAISDDGDIIEGQKDMAWLRKQRLAMEELSIWVKRGIVTTVLSGLLYLMWVALKMAMGGKL